MKKFMRSPIATVAMFVVAGFLLIFGTVNGIQAAPRIESEDYRAQVQLTNINVAVTENGTVVEGEDALLGDSFFELNGMEGAQDFKIGKKYDDVLSVRNTQHPSSTNEGEGIEEYVRVSVYRYWTDGSGKAVNLDPSLIDINFINTDANDTGYWTIDEAASTPERTVLYYSEIVPVYTGEQRPDGTYVGDTAPFADAITIDSSVATQMSGANYKYEGVTFHVKAVADAVQTHNGEEAMNSAWGRTIKD